MDPSHAHQCPACQRVWPLPEFMALPDLGVQRRLIRSDGAVREYQARMRRCKCGQLLEQAAKIGAEG